jgi:hypothetical protein
MARQCKLCICDESIRIKLESLIENGSSYLKASSYARKEFGFSISHTAIQRHYENHKLKHKRDVDIVQDVDLNAIESDGQQLKRTIINKLRRLVDVNITEFSKGKVKFPKEEGRLLNALEKTYKEDIAEVNIEESQKIYHGPNDDYVLLPGNENYTPAEFENYMRYAKMMLGLSTPKPTSSVIIEPPESETVLDIS